MPTFIAAYNNLGIAYTRMGNVSKAEESFLKLISLSEVNNKAHRESAKAYINLGFLANNRGNFQKAIEYLEKGLSYDSSNPEIYNHIGIAKCGLGYLHDGARFFEMALHVMPMHNAAKVNLQRVKETLIKEHNVEATM